jgi:hypothetical protein
MPDTLGVETLYGAHSRQGLVQITLGGKSCQLSVHDALQHARFVIEAANAAASDMLLVRFLTDRMGLPLEAAAAALQDMRAMRRKFDAEADT